MNIKNEPKFKQIPVILTWDRREKEPIKGTTSYNWVYRPIFVNCSNGKMGHSVNAVIKKDKPFLLMERKSKTVYGYSFQYDKRHNKLVLIFAKFDARTIKEGETRQWQELYRCYILPNKDIYAKYFYWQWNGSNYEPVPREKEMTCLSCLSFSSLPYDIKKLIDLNENHNAHIEAFDSYTEVRKMFPPIISLAGNRIFPLNEAWKFCDFINYYEPVKKDGPKQKKIDELVSYKLNDIDFSKIITKRTDRYDNSYKFAIIEKVPCEENYCVLRTFTKDIKTGIAGEGGRIYFNKNSAMACKSNNLGTYIYTPLLKKSDHWKFDLLDYDTELTKGTMLEYYTSILPEFEGEYKGIAIWAFAQWPIFEKLCKLGYMKFVKSIFKNSYYMSPKERLEGIIGKISSDKDLYKAIGMNKYQLEALKEYLPNFQSYYNFNITKFIKRVICGAEQHTAWNDRLDYASITNIDNDTFDMLLDIAIRINDFTTKSRSSYYDIYATPNTITNIFVYLNRLYGTKVIKNIKEKVLNICFEKCERYSYNANYSLYHDYLRMVSQIEDTVHFKPYFDTAEDITSMHEAAQTLINLKKNEYQVKKFDERKEIWNKFVYSDENYSIIYPESPEEIAKEGITLKHCVKSYIDRVCEGRTNILFLRKTSEMNQPFFTIEISDKGNVEQIHGSCNRNVSSEPDMIYFVNNWIEELKLNNHNFNKVR